MKTKRKMLDQLLLIYVFNKLIGFLSGKLSQILKFKDTIKLNDYIFFD
jgi:hypothetical protein